MSIHEQENTLFAQWRSYLNAHNQHFIADGVVNEEEWKAAPRKIVFLLKETNSEDYEWDERDYLQNYPLADANNTVRYLSQWIPGILVAGESPSWNWVYAITQSRLTQTDLLRKICWVNVKKSPGGSTVEQNAFNTYWRQQENQQFLRQQLDLYAPDIIVCCGTSWNYIEAYRDCNLQPLLNEDGIEYYFHGQRLVINFYHPLATTYTKENFYNLLCKVVQEHK